MPPTDQFERDKADFRSLVLFCARMDPDKETSVARYDGNPGLTQAITRLFRLMARLQQTAPGWLPEPDHPGYLAHRHEDAAMVAPFHLAADLPEGGALANLRSVAVILKVGNASAMCLSGSAVALGDPRYFGDLDFCEYIPENEAQASIATLADIAHNGRDGATCTEIKIRSRRITRPWKDRCRADALMALLGPSPAGASGKADHVLRTPATGPVEATNVMVWIHPDRSDADAAKVSFPYQETDIGTAAAPWIPRQLDRPSNIARYVRFLRSDIGKYRREKPVKALKRALSLTSFLMLETHQENILALARQTTNFESEAIRQRKLLLDMLAGHEDPAVRALVPDMRASLGDWLRGRTATRHDPDSGAFNERADTIIGSVLRDVDALSARV